MRLGGAIAAGLILALLVAHTARGAECWAAVRPETAAPGDEVTLEIHKLGCDFWGDDLYLVPESGYESPLAQGRLCSAMKDALLIGPISWTHYEGDHQGVLRFRVPDLPDGVYVLGEDLANISPHCDRNGTLTVTSGGPPDTAMPQGPGGAMATAIGLSLILLAIGVAWRQVAEDGSARARRPNARHLTIRGQEMGRTRPRGTRKARF